MVTYYTTNTRLRPVKYGLMTSDVTEMKNHFSIVLTDLGGCTTAPIGKMSQYDALPVT